MTLSACSVSNDPSMRPYLPSPPSTFGLPVPVPQPVAGQDARAFAAVTRASLLGANQRLRNDKAFQADVWTRFSHGGSAR
jgi:hypothetical protein